MPVRVFWDATASHKSAEGRYIHYEWCHLTVVEKRGAVKRECACRGAIRLPDEQSEEPCEARSQEAAREHQPSEFFQNRAEGRKGSAAQSKIGEPPSPLCVDKVSLVMIN